MSLTNYISQDYLKKFVPELERYLWTEQADYSQQIELAVQEVNNDFIAYGSNLSKLRPELYLTDDVISIEDVASRIRAVVNVTSFSGVADKTISIQGSSSSTSPSWNEVATFTVSGTGEQTAIISKPYSFYRYVATIPDGSMTAQVYMVEAVFDNFYAYKALYIIIENKINTPGDKYDLWAQHFLAKYNALWGSAKWFTDEDGELIGSNVGVARIIR